EVVVDGEADAERPHAVDPRLLVVDVANPGGVRDLDRTAAAVGRRRVGAVVGLPRVAAVIADAVVTNEVHGLAHVTEVGAVLAEPVVHVPLRALAPHRVLDTHHALDERRGGEGPARLAWLLILHGGDPGPAPAHAPVDRAGGPAACGGRRDTG